MIFAVGSMVYVSILKLGFTGTRNGMTRSQRRAVIGHLDRWSLKYDLLEVHHGDCIGADSDFHDLCTQFWGKELRVVIHPPVDSSRRAWKSYQKQITLSPVDFIKRNHDIVASVDGMLAAPAESQEILRSGTWATIRHARKTGVPLILLNP